MKLTAPLLIMGLSALALSASSVNATVALDGHGKKGDGDTATASGQRNVQAVAYDQTKNGKQYGMAAVAVTGTGNISAGEPCQGLCNLSVEATVALGFGTGVIDPLGASWQAVINPATQSFKDIEAKGSGLYVYYPSLPGKPSDTVVVKVNGQKYAEMTPGSSFFLDAFTHGATPELTFSVDHPLGATTSDLFVSTMIAVYGT